MVKKQKTSLVHKHLLFWGIIVISICVDQLSKVLIREFAQSRIIVIPNFFSLMFIENTGAGFSLFSNWTSLIIWASIIIIGVILYHYDKIITHSITLWAFAFIVGGGVGNLIDRIFLGGVTDFFWFYIIFDTFPPFNIADTAISLGAILLIIHTLKEGKEKKSIS